jgi:hypothetical protein
MLVPHDDADPAETTYGVLSFTNREDDALPWSATMA